MKTLNELDNAENALLNSLTDDQRHEWYLNIKRSLPKLKQLGSTERIELAIAEYERKNGLL